MWRRGQAHLVFVQRSLREFARIIKSSFCHSNNPWVDDRILVCGLAPGFPIGRPSSAKVDSSTGFPRLNPSSRGRRLYFECRLNFFIREGGPIKSKKLAQDLVVVDIPEDISDICIFTCFQVGIC